MNLTLTYSIEPAGVIALAILFAIYFLFNYAIRSKSSKKETER